MHQFQKKIIQQIRILTILVLHITLIACDQTTSNQVDTDPMMNHMSDHNDMIGSPNLPIEDAMASDHMTTDLGIHDLVNPSLGGDPDGPSICEKNPVQVEQEIRTLLSQMSLEEKIAQMHGSQLLAIDDLYYSGANDRLSIESFRMVDGPRGVRAGYATAFPVAMARGASWNPQLEQQIGEAIGAETRGKGGNVILAPCVNVLRHPRWGRAQETYGEDPMHIGELGVGFVQGAQQHVVATAKHFAVNSIEDTRFEVNVRVDERTLREVYLPHFKKLVTQGHVAAVMSAYNQVNDSFCSENQFLLRQVLKGEWGFRGIVMSDWLFGVHHTQQAIQAGLDIEMPVDRVYGDALLAALENEDIDVQWVDDAVARILRVKLCYAHTDDEEDFGMRVESDAHADLALQAAREGSVLLKNDANILPLKRDQIRSLVVLGPLANVVNLGDQGSSTVTPSQAITVWEGLQAHSGEVDLHLIDHNAPFSPQEEQWMREADAVIVVTGLAAEDEGESLIAAGDRSTLSLSEEKNDLIQMVSMFNANTIIVLEGGSAIIVEPWIDQVAALLLAWYPGQEGGRAIAELLWGDVVPSGKLPITFPRAEEDLPPFDNVNLEVNYDALHGYRYVAKHGIVPRYPFGHGLSYTEFEYSALDMLPMVLMAGEPITLSVTIHNTGSYEATEIIQVYVVQDELREESPLSLKGFQRITLQAGAIDTINITIPYDELARYDLDEQMWKVHAGTYSVLIGSSSQDIRLESTVVIMP